MTMKKKVLSYLTSLLALVAVATTGYGECHDDHCGRSDSCCEDGNFNLSAHLQVIKPCQTVNYIKVPNAANTIETVYGFDHDWDWGVAIKASYNICNEWSLLGRYSYIQADTGNNHHTIASGLVVLLGVPIRAGIIGEAFNSGGANATIDAELETDMHTFDLLAQYDCCLCGSFKFKPFGGIRFIKLENEMKVLMNEIVAVRFVGGEHGNYGDQELTAYGVIGGFDWEWNLCGDFYLVGSLSASALTSKEDIILKQITNADTFTYITNDTCKGIIGVDANIGVAWNTCLFGKGVDLQAIYETRVMAGVDSVTESLGDDDLYSVHGFKVGFGLPF